ncbi:MAG: hypothetical protein UX66_C0020G0010 [Parcubacteria group bacterium GW2011_GWF2_46_8]|nr:MAG: hypothetical protein UX66_C0020G0010 [Parcubacteria group bacterium GW2011_GWF2_46_8]
MERIFISEIPSHVGKEVMVSGWVHAIRAQGSIAFLLVRDRSGLAQAVVLKSSGDGSLFELVKSLSVESVVSVTGKVKQEAQAPGGYEIEPIALTVLSKAAPELPIPVVVEKSGGETDITKRFDWRWLDLRRPEKLKIFQVWTALEQGFREQFAEEGFIQIYAPSFMNAPSESGTDVFEVKYFEKKAYLAQSPQFYKQMAMASGFEKVFMVGPVFRAEPSFTTRHMTEFTGWDFEMSYINSHHEVMDIEEKLLVAGFKKVNESTRLGVEVPSMPFPRLTMAEIKGKLKANGVPSEKEGDLSPDEERKICELIKEETGSDFVWVIDYPASVRAFYHMRHEDKPTLTKSFDLLYKGVEITTGAQREHRVEILEKQAQEKGIGLDSIKDYLNFFRYGCPSHGGVGIGPGRIIMGMLDLPSVKEATFLPRDVKRLNP